tara:strand:+ start:343 stop:471 length:129 start_codon:yes stop_codon:yes gene_type:complete
MMDWESFWTYFLFIGLLIFLFVSFTTARSGFRELRDFFNKKD